MRLSILIFFTLLLFSSFSHSAIYEWTNEQGNKAYTQAPPSDKSISSKKLVVKSQKVTASFEPVDVSDDITDANPADNTNETSPEAEAKKIAEGKRLLKEQCSNAKSAIAGLEGGNRLYKDSKGNYLRMSEKEKAKRRKNINSFMDEHCK